MELISNSSFLSLLARMEITWSQYGYGYPVYLPKVETFCHYWRTTNLFEKQLPNFFTLLMGAINPWEGCIIAKCHTEYYNPFFEFEYDCPVLGTNCLVNPGSIDEDGEVEECKVFDSFCIDQWARFDAIHRLEIPSDFTGALCFSPQEEETVFNIALLASYSHDYWNDLMVIPTHGQQIVVINHEDAIEVIYRDAEWGNKTVDLLTVNGFPCTV